ncbi:MAG: cation:proton antiporter [Nitrospira sp.]|nr:cation:proton antiporter [Nitrospira sp.]
MDHRTFEQSCFYLNGPVSSGTMDLPSLLLNLIAVYVSARLFGELAARLGQPAVLGELLAGVLVGGSLLGWVEATPTLKLLGDIGVLLLLFEVGLESDLAAFLKAGPSAGTVAVVGVFVPFGLTYALARALALPHFQALFLGATMTATSVAISVRTLADLGRLKSVDGAIILGAAVLDDILGMILLSVMLDLAAHGSVSWLGVAQTAGLACLLLGASVAVGVHYAHWFSRLLDRMQTRGSLVISSLLFALGLGYGAHLLHLAPLIGAFAAGLVLARTGHREQITTAIKPVADVFVPVFFVLIGAAVDLSRLNPFVLENWPSLALAGGLTGAAIAGKLAAGLGAWGPGVRRWIVGAGMVPGGEVVLIFAGAGLAQAVFSTAEYGAVVVSVTLTSLASPLLLKRLSKPA